MVTVDELVALTQAYKNICESAKITTEILHLGFRDDKMAVYANFVCKKFEEYMKQSEKPVALEAKPKDETPKPKKPSQAEINEHFEKLWQLYPSKRGKNSVSTSRRAKLFDVSLSDMAQAVNRYVGELEQKGKMDFILNGSTWFNGRYEDYMDSNFSQIDGAAPSEEKPKGRFDALSPSEMKDYISRGIINPEDESVNWFAMSSEDSAFLKSKGVI